MIKKKGLNNLLINAFAFEDNTYHLNYKTGIVTSENP